MARESFEGMGEVTEAWTLHYTSAAKSASPGRPLVSHPMRQAQAFSMGTVDSFEMLGHAGRGPMGFGALLFLSTASVPGSGQVAPASCAPGIAEPSGATSASMAGAVGAPDAILAMLGEIRTGQVDLGRRVAQLELPKSQFVWEPVVAS